MSVNCQLDPRSEGRPYRSHLHPACFSCRRRKSRCKTRDSSAICIMCQAHGTECSFPRPDDPIQRQVPAVPSKPRAHVKRRSAHTRHRLQHAQSYTGLQHVAHPIPVDITDTAASGNACTDPKDDSRMPMATNSEQRAKTLSSLMGIDEEAGDNSSHIVSPAVAEDNEVLEKYLSAVPTAQRGSLIRTGSASNCSLRPVRFNVVSRRPLGVSTTQSLAVSKCEIIEKYMHPDLDEYLNLFFEKANTCFPIFDETSFRSVYSSHKGNLSSALLCNLYANSLVYWESSPKLSAGRTPDIRFIWNQANEALHSELFMSPGISTVMSILINVCGRPSTSMFGNGGMVGTAVALSNALGLNRDPSNWSITPLEKSFRIRLWSLVLIHDRWCSLAYGTPLQVHRSQYDVPFPTLDDICNPTATSYQKATASIFIALTTLTNILAQYLENVYSVSKSCPSTEMSALDLECLLSEWEETLTEDVRRIALRGTLLNVPGAANFRLAYLAVKLLLRRIQLDLSQASTQVIHDTMPPCYANAQRVAEEIMHLVQELNANQLTSFWLPIHAFSITSATMFLLRCSLHTRNQSHNLPLQIAKDMIYALQVHKDNFGWDIADDCLSNCSGLVEKFGNGGLSEGSDLSSLESPDLTQNLDIDPTALDQLFFGAPWFPGACDF
ncbi:unnamed protein product [Penicillium salamii]|uniref:Zn(2)-C6 fungal-type domain-containing protein n=1 Tax=Penicillium salamii TaxID=1612424 RepID=A0A9W4J125_9EURO|nr:unnamed protein product [Penicillium salamii]